TVDDTIVIVYNAAEGNRGLMGAAEVYAHTGVITSRSTSSSDWKYVKTQWGQNTAETRMTPLGNNRWQIRFHIRSYYGIPANEKVKQLAFVFRNANSTREGKTAEGGDIFLPIYEDGLAITLLSPASTPAFIEIGDTLLVQAAANRADSIFLEQDGEIVIKTDDDTLSWRLPAQSAAKHRIRIIAGDQSGAAKTISFYCIIRPLQSGEALPADAQDGFECIDGTWRFVLFAPHKSFVYLIGDFNNWEADPAFLMQPTVEKDRYWLEVKRVAADQEFGYQYWVDGALKIADPFAEKVLDPVHDAHISKTVYPALMPYPINKTTEIVSVLQPQDKQVDWKAVDFRRPAVDTLVIYELLVRDFTKEHSYSALIDKVQYLKQLGVNAVELMPINEFEGNSSWGYNPSFYFAPDKYYGPAAQLKRFIDVAHTHGIAVILDIVLNHSYGQSPMVRLYLDQPQQSPWYNRVSPNPVYSWGYDFNHESPATQAFVDRVLQYWLEEYQVDGFRFDFSKGFTNTAGDGYAYDQKRITNLKRIANRVQSIDSTAYLILEHFTDNREEKELTEAGFLIWGNSNYNFNEATMGWHENSKSDFSWGVYTKRGWKKPHLVTYMESHDEERLMVKNLLWGNENDRYDVKELPIALQRMQTAAAFLFMIPGPKMIWQFGELGYDVSIDDNGRTGEKPVRWEYYDDPLRQSLFHAFSALIHLKKNRTLCLPRRMDYSFSSPFKWMKINYDSLNLTLAGNFDVVPMTKTISFEHSGKWFDYMSQDSLQIAQRDTLLTWAPGEYRLYIDRKISNAGSPLHVGTKDAKITDMRLLDTYPNPFNPQTTIRFRLIRTEKINLVIYNALGRQVRRLMDGVQVAGEHTVIWDGNGENGERCASGLYFCRFSTDDRAALIKMTLLR
ncbi:MAG: T9SS C-terminal target domain-containing protein, partial [Calditrichaeota bacterium]